MSSTNGHKPTSLQPIAAENGPAETVQTSQTDNDASTKRSLEEITPEQDDLEASTVLRGGGEHRRRRGPANQLYYRKRPEDKEGCCTIL